MLPASGSAILLRPPGSLPLSALAAVSPTQAAGGLRCRLLRLLISSLAPGEFPAVPASKKFSNTPEITMFNSAVGSYSTTLTDCLTKVPAAMALGVNRPPTLTLCKVQFRTI